MKLVNFIYFQIWILNLHYISDIKKYIFKNFNMINSNSNQAIRAGSRNFNREASAVTFNELNDLNSREALGIPMRENLTMNSHASIEQLQVASINRSQSMDAQSPNFQNSGNSVQQNSQRSSSRFEISSHPLTFKSSFGQRMLKAAAQKKNESCSESVPEEKNSFSDRNEDFILINHKNSSSCISGYNQEFENKVSIHESLNESVAAPYTFQNSTVIEGGLGDYQHNHSFQQTPPPDIYSFNIQNEVERPRSGASRHHAKISLVDLESQHELKVQQQACHISNISNLSQNLEENDELDEQLKRVQVQLEEKLVRPQQKLEEFQTNQEPLRHQRNGPINKCPEPMNQYRPSFFPNVMQYSTIQEEKKAVEQDSKLNQTFNFCKPEISMVIDDVSSQHLRQSDTPIEVQMSYNSCSATPAYVQPQMFSPAGYVLANGTGPRAQDSFNKQIEKLNEEMQQRATNMSNHVISEPQYAPQSRVHFPSQPCTKCQQYAEQINQLTNKQAQLENQIKKYSFMLESDELKMEKMEETIIEYQTRYANSCQDKLSENRLNQLLTEQREKCRKLEETMKEETALSEKQRAEIQLLRISLEQGVHKLGISFKNKQHLAKLQTNGGRIHDGYLHIVQQEQVIEQQRQKIRSLDEKYQTAEMKNRELVESLQSNKDAEQSIMNQHYTKQLDNAKLFQQELQKDKQNLQADKSALQAQAEELQQIIREKESVILKQNHELKTKDDNLNFQKEKGHQSAQLNKEKIEDIDKLSRELITQREQSILTKEEINKQEQKLLIAEKSCKHLQELNREYSKQIKEKVTELQEYQGIICNLKKEQENKDDVIIEKQTEICRMEATIQEVNDENAELQAQIGRINTRNEEIEQQKSDLKENLAKTQNELQKLINYLEEQERQKLIEESERIRKQQGIHKDYQEQQRENSVHKDTICKLNEELDSLQQLLQKEKETSEKLQAEVQTLAAKHQQIVSSSSTTEQLKNQLQKQNEDLSNLMNMKEDENQRIKNEMLVMQNAIEEKDVVVKQLEGKLQLQNERAEIDRQKVELQCEEKMMELTNGQVRSQTLGFGPGGGDDKFSSQIIDQVNQILSDLSYFAQSVRLIDNLDQKYILLSQFEKQQASFGKAQSAQDICTYLMQFGVCFNHIFQTIFQMELLIENQTQQLEADQQDHKMQIKVDQIEMQKDFEIEANENLQALVRKMANFKELGPGKREDILELVSQISYLKQLNIKFHQTFYNLQQSEEKMKFFSQQPELYKKEIINLNIEQDQNILQGIQNDIEASMVKFEHLQERMDDDSIGLTQLITESKLYREMEQQKISKMKENTALKEEIVKLKQKFNYCKRCQQSLTIVAVDKEVQTEKDSSLPCNGSHFNDTFQSMNINAFADSRKIGCKHSPLNNAREPSPQNLYIQVPHRSSRSTIPVATDLQTPALSQYDNSILQKQLQSYRTRFASKFNNAMRRNDNLDKENKVSYHSSLSNKNADTVKKLQMPIKENVKNNSRLEKLIESSKKQVKNNQFTLMSTQNLLEKCDIEYQNQAEEDIKSYRSLISNNSLHSTQHYDNNEIYEEDQTQLQQNIIARDIDEFEQKKVLVSALNASIHVSDEINSCKQMKDSCQEQVTSQHDASKKTSDLGRLNDHHLVIHQLNSRRSEAPSRIPDGRLAAVGHQRQSTHTDAPSQAKYAPQQAAQDLQEGYLKRSNSSGFKKTSVQEVNHNFQSFDLRQQPLQPIYPTSVRRSKAKNTYGRGQEAQGRLPTENDENAQQLNIITKDFKCQQDSWMEPQPTSQPALDKSTKSIEPCIDTQKLLEFSKYNSMKILEKQRPPKSRPLSRNHTCDQEGSIDNIDHLMEREQSFFKDSHLLENITASLERTVDRDTAEEKSFYKESMPMGASHLNTDANNSSNNLVEEGSQMKYTYEKQNSKQDHVSACNPIKNQIEVQMDEFEIENEFEQQQNFEFGYQRSQYNFKEQLAIQVIANGGSAGPKSGKDESQYSSRSVQMEEFQKSFVKQFDQFDVDDSDQ